MSAWAARSCRRRGRLAARRRRRRERDRRRERPDRQAGHASAERRRPAGDGTLGIERGDLPDGDHALASNPLAPWSTSRRRRRS